jgi:hypothetical protein
VLVGGAAVVVGTATLLLLARYEMRYVVLGAGFVLAGVLAFLSTPLGRRRSMLLALAAAVLATVSAWGIARARSGSGPEPDVPPPRAGTDLANPTSAQALARGLQMARDALVTIEAVDDYTCTFAKRERARNIFGKEVLTDFTMSLKIRHQPFSVYLRFESPEGKRGTEAIYVEDANDGRLVAHSTTGPGRLMGTMRLDPAEWGAMVDNRYPITRAGIRNLLIHLLALAESQERYLARCDVRILPDRSVGGRPCTCLEIRSPAPADDFRLALARVCFDDVWTLPVHSETWEFVDVDGEHRELLVERYVYSDLVLDPGLEDLDFDPANPAYGY